MAAHTTDIEMGLEMGDIRRGSSDLPPGGVRFQIEDVDDNSFNKPPTTDPVVTTGPHTATSIGYNTSEAIPKTVYYRDQDGDKGLPRPSLDALHDLRTTNTRQQSTTEEEAIEITSTTTGGKRKWWPPFQRNKSGKKQPRKLGWIQGVLIRCLLNIWGVMLFIRLSWVVGQAGIGLSSLIIVLSTVVTIVTTLSMSAICTNGEVKGGGAYYLISRSLGPEFGGAIGIIFSLANAVAVGLYVVGFTETLTELLVRHDATIPGLSAVNHIRIFGAVTALLLLGIALIGLDWESKIQIVLLIVLLVALFVTLIGSFIPRACDNYRTLQGFSHYRWDTFVDNIGPNFQGESFFSVFSVFFPAATGILAGANISGDLKNPQVAIPKGTLLAIIISSLVYLGVAWMLGITVIRTAPGLPEEYFGSIGTQFMCSSGLNISEFGSNLTYCTSTVFDLDTIMNYNESCTNCTGIPCGYGDSTSDLGILCGGINAPCAYGSLNYFQIMEMISLYGPIVTAGIFAATLSSALASLVSAPKVFQRVCQDKIFPFIEFFGKGGWRGTGNEPIRGYFLTFIIAIACIAIGELNTIALIISNFFLMAYTLINFSCFAASFSKSPGWRPAFKFYSKWVALAGSALCLSIMFVISWWAALITLVAVGALYFIVVVRKPDINWGSSGHAFLHSFAVRNLLKMEKHEIHVKNFRPQFLVLTGPPSSRPDLVYFFSLISQDTGVTICGHVLEGDHSANRRLLLSDQQKQWLRLKKIKAFHNIVTARSLRDGTQSLLQLSGLGKIKPNILSIGFKNNWKQATQIEIEEYVNLLHDAFDLQFGVVIFRLRAGFDVTEHNDSFNTTPENDRRKDDNSSDQQEQRDSPTAGLLSRKESSLPLLNNTPPPVIDPYSGRNELVDVPLEEESLPSPPSSPIKDALNMSITSLKSSTSYHPINDEEEDDDDIAISKAEIFTENTGVDSVLHETSEIITLPSRFAKKQESGFIDVWWLYDDGGLAILLPFLLSRNPLWKNCKLRIFVAGTSDIDSARVSMTALLRKFRIGVANVTEVQGIDQRPSKDSIDTYLALPLDEGTDYSNLDKKTLKMIRLGELLKEKSLESKLIVVTIPVPRRGGSSRQYMSWLESISSNLPPTLLMRGNQTSVLTFYS